MPSSRVAASLVLILVLAGGLRILGFTWGLPDENHHYPYSIDENNVIWTLSRMEPAKLKFDPIYYENPTFFYYLSGAAIQVSATLGLVHLTASGEYYRQNPHEYRKLYIIPRALAYLMGVGSVLLVFLLAKRLFGAGTGLLSALFLALAPSHIVNSRLMTLAAPVAFWMLLSVLFIVSFMKNRRTRDYILAGLFAGLALSTKHSAAVLVVAILVGHLLHLEKANLKIALKHLWSKNLWLSYGALAVAFALTSPYFILNYEEALAKSYANPNYLYNVNLSGFLFDIINPVIRAGFGLGFLLCALCLLGIFWAMRTRSKADILLLTLIAAYYLAMVKLGYYATDRRLMPVYPFVLVLGARVLIGLLEQRGAVKRLAWAGAIVVCLTTLIYDTVIIHRFLAPDYRESASHWFKENMAAGTTFAVFAPPYWDMPNHVTADYQQQRHYGNGNGAAYYNYDMVETPEGLSDTEAEFVLLSQRLFYHRFFDDFAQFDTHLKEQGFEPYQQFQQELLAFQSWLDNRYTWDLLFNYDVYVYRKAEAAYSDSEI